MPKAPEVPRSAAFYAVTFLLPYHGHFHFLKRMQSQPSMRPFKPFLIQTVPASQPEGRLCSFLTPSPHLIDLIENAAS